MTTVLGAVAAAPGAVACWLHGCDKGAASVELHRQTFVAASHESLSFPRLDSIRWGLKVKDWNGLTGGIEIHVLF